VTITACCCSSHHVTVSGSSAEGCTGDGCRKAAGLALVLNEVIYICARCVAGCVFCRQLVT
jgi:hypothetical protein